VGGCLVGEQKVAQLCRTPPMSALQAGFAMTVVQEAVQMHTIVAMVAAGLGIALVPGSLHHLHQPGVVYRPCDPSRASLRAEIAVAWRRADPSSVVAAFLQVARDSHKQ
jgi:DNA-binding transcriptional LysR family regulator